MPFFVGKAERSEETGYSVRLKSPLSPSLTSSGQALYKGEDL